MKLFQLIFLSCGILLLTSCGDEKGSSKSESNSQSGRNLSTAQKTYNWTAEGNCNGKTVKTSECHSCLTSCTTECDKINDLTKKGQCNMKCGTVGMNCGK